MTKQIAPFGLRLPPELKKIVELEAHRNHRSQNAEITVQLENAYRSTIDRMQNETSSSQKATAGHPA